METWHNNIRANIHTRAFRNSLSPHAIVSVSPFGPLHPFTLNPPLTKPFTWPQNTTRFIQISLSYMTKLSRVIHVCLCMCFCTRLEGSGCLGNLKVSASPRAESWRPIAIAAPAAAAVVNRIFDQLWPDRVLLVCSNLNLTPCSKYISPHVSPQHIGLLYLMFRLLSKHPMRHSLRVIL